MTVETKIGSGRQLVQDLIAPELSSLKANLVALHDKVNQGTEAIQRQLDQRFDQVDQRFKADREHINQRLDQVDQRFRAVREHIDQRFKAERDYVDLRFDAIMAEFRNQRERSDFQTRSILDAMSSFTAQNDVSSLRNVVGDLMIRVAVLESKVSGSSKGLESGSTR